MSSSRLGEAIEEFLSQALSGNHEVQHKSLQTLASITKLSPQNRELLAKTDGAIPLLLALTKSPSTTIQTLSLSTLFNLSLQPDLKQSLASMDTIYHLNSKIISLASPESSKLASALICSLAMLDKNKAKFGVAGTVELLVKGMAAPYCPASHLMLSALAELVQYHGNCTLAVRAGAVEVLLRVVEGNDGEDLSGTSLAILGLLARFNEGLNALVKTDEIVGKMVNVLKGRYSLSKEGAVEILVRLFDASEGCVRDATRLQEFSTMLVDLSIRGSARARQKSDLLMRKMAESNLESYVDIEIPFGSPI